MNIKKMILISGISSILLLTGCSALEYPKADYQPSKQEAVYLIAGRSISTANSVISSKISGKVKDIFVKKGDFVKAGNPLIKLETTELEAQLNQAKAGIDLAQANYEKIKAGVRLQQIVQAKASLENANKAKEIAELNYQRSNQLYQSGAISKQQLETSELQFQSATSQQQTLAAQLDMLSSGETNESIKIAQAQINQAKSSYEMVKAQMENGILSAPFDGVISEMNIEIGEIASPGKKILSIEGGSLKVEADIPESFSYKINQGDEVMVKFPDFSDKEYNGVVDLLSPDMDNSGKGLKIEVKVNETDIDLKPGMFAEIGLKNDLKIGQK